MITSTANARVKLVRTLLDDRQARQRQRKWCLEGVRLIEEGLAADLPFEFVFFVPDEAGGARRRSLLHALQARGAPCEPVAPHVLRAASDTMTPQGILAVAPWPAPRTMAVDGLLLILDRLADPGNLGTILRTALAAGCAGVVLTPGSVDPYNPKVVRSAMGAHLRLPLLAAGGWEQITAVIGSRPLWLADVQGSVTYDEVDWRAPSALIIGSEAAGAGTVARAAAQGRVAIPMASGESLNAAAAAAVFCFEAARQLRQRSG